MNKPSLGMMHNYVGIPFNMVGEYLVFFSKEHEHEILVGGIDKINMPFTNVWTPVTISRMMKN